MKSHRVGVLITLSEAGLEEMDRWKHQITGRGARDSKTGEMCPEIKHSFHANSELSVGGWRRKEGMQFPVEKLLISTLAKQ